MTLNVMHVPLTIMTGAVGAAVKNTSAIEENKSAMARCKKRTLGGMLRYDGVLRSTTSKMMLASSAMDVTKLNSTVLSKSGE
ncbi:hypothetical protein E2C01_017481 [Portunus trituberculatus]|uniref:Uncharacterized protein n=1 Tax=Portunus trituberculatus TaxID=210409 RepID=A0A5B7DRZ5_PORTR|nr:hypothetical protein [Portunus trituberculatus]